MFYVRQMSRQMSREREQSISSRKSTDSLRRGSVIDGLIGAGKIDNRISTGDTESAAEKDLKRDLDNQYAISMHYLISHLGSSIYKPSYCK